MCLVNNAVYIAQTKEGKWSATGTQFIQPYVYKSLFTHDKIEFEDLCEMKSVKTEMYLDMNEELQEGEHDYRFVGKVGAFCPIQKGKGGGILLRKGGEDKYDAVAGTKNYRWLESEFVKTLKKEDYIDLEYYNTLANNAFDDISKFGDAEWFVSDAKYEKPKPLCNDCSADEEICKKCIMYMKNGEVNDDGTDVYECHDLPF